MMNCMIIDDDLFSRKVLTQLVTITDELELEETCNNAVEAISILETKKIDLLLLDIEMPGISGLQLINSIKNPPLIIVISATKHAFVNVNVIDFIIKPISPELFSNAVKKAKDLFYKKEEIVTN
ncbi:MAG: response regulator [Bacteroidia bacterium]